MGSNLAVNLVRHGFSVVGYDLEADKIQALTQAAMEGMHITSAKTLSELIDDLDAPRCILLMVPAGQIVDDVIVQLMPLLTTDDILIDGGNSHCKDTERCIKTLCGQCFHFVGMGISGGEQGALRGPCLMPGGEYVAWKTIAPMLHLIAAKAGDGQPCAAYIGPRGAGCIIRSGILERIMTAFRQNPNLSNLMLDDIFRIDLENHIESLRFVVQTAIGPVIPILALSASLGYFDAYRSEQLPANFIQAMRNYFGVHTYRRIDRQGVFHTEWY